MHYSKGRGEHNPWEGIGCSIHLVNAKIALNTNLFMSIAILIVFLRWQEKGKHSP